MKITPWTQIQNKAAEKTVVIDIEGYIGFQPWEAPEAVKNTKEAMKTELKKIAEVKDKAETIIVNINSYGGDVNHGVSIHDLLAESKAKVITKVNGHTASAATIIAQAGNERQMSDNALFLIHHAWAFSLGNTFELQGVVEDLKTMDNSLSKIYSKRSGKSIDEIMQLMDVDNGNGKWLTADEAMEYGLIDEVYEPMQAAAAVNIPAQFKNHFPELPDKYKSFKNNIVEPQDLKGDENIMEPKELLQKMTDMFGAEFANSAFLAGKSMEDCQADFIANQKTEINNLTVENQTLKTDKESADAKIVELQAKIDKLEEGSDPVPPSAGAAGKQPNASEERFEDKLNSLVKDGMKKSDALIKAAAEHPELYKNYLKAANNGKDLDLSYLDN